MKLLCDILPIILLLLCFVSINVYWIILNKKYKHLYRDQEKAKREAEKDLNDFINQIF